LGASLSVAVADGRPPTVTVAQPELVATAASEAGAVVPFAANVSAQDGAGSASLPVTCVPTSGSAFPIGTTTVSCTAEDALHNSGSTSFRVTVRPSAPPDLATQDVVAEALGPGGAVVDYQIAASGFIADCAP